MPCIDGSIGEKIAVSNGAMATLHYAWWMIATSRRQPETEDEKAVEAWLLTNRQPLPHQYATAFTLFPPEEDLASPERLACFARLGDLLI